MTELQASRTLVKSPPELWAECSDAASLARHLDGFGEIRITRLEPETAVAWEGERARGTVRIEPAGWGTKVILTAVQEGEEAVADAPPEPEPAVAVAPPAPESLVVEASSEAVVEEPPPRVRKRRWARLKAYWRGVPRPEEPEEPEEPVGELEAPPEATLIEEPAVVLEEPATLIEEPAVVLEEPAVVLEEPAVVLEEPSIAPEEPAAVSGTEAALSAALDSLGQAHHRPYSRA
ncbi:MAG TPA: hypothetical protein VLC49_08410 [Solirubrobacteraceae bacterium]|nr:hypothetical protein [Solirubrobacteraceae bacterium]